MISSEFGGQFGDVPKPPVLYSYFAIWAEENGALSRSANNGYQWAFGNGANAPNGAGVKLAFKCELIALSLSMFNENANVPGRSVRVRVYKNGSNTGQEISGKEGNSLIQPLSREFEDTPVVFYKEQAITFRTISVVNTSGTQTTTSGGGIVTAFFRRKIQ